MKKLLFLLAINFSVLILAEETEITNIETEEITSIENKINPKLQIPLLPIPSREDSFVQEESNLIEEN